MAKFVEMDEKVTLKDQMQENETRSVILINKFKVVPEQIEQFLIAWTEDATNFKEQPGFISTQLHKGVGRSTVFINYAVWESMKHYKNAVNKVIGPDFQSILSKYPDLKSFLLIFRKTESNIICRIEIAKEKEKPLT
jgi:quinol monooxygenase YgiN